jgi:hypothetical protein
MTNDPTAPRGALAVSGLEVRENNALALMSHPESRFGRTYADGEKGPTLLGDIRLEL